jgi:ATP/ADP translocase
MSPPNPPPPLNSNSINNFADEEDENNNSSLHPLLSSIKRKIKMGSFSIRYSPPQRNKSAAVSTGEQYHDFTTNDNDNYDSGDHGNGDDDDLIISRLQYNRNNKSFASRLLHQLLPSSPYHNYYYTPKLRIILLSLYLAFTLSSFWILDSIKEPTLAILVNGDLGHHQPRAKMVSFVVVIVLAIGMEWLDRLRRQQQQWHFNNTRQSGGVDDNNDDIVDRINQELEQSWADRNLPLSAQRMMSSTSSSSVDNNDDYDDDHDDDDRKYNIVPTSKWKRMKVQTSQLWQNHFTSWTNNNNNNNNSYSTTSQDDNNDEQSSSSSSKITTIAFYIVGSFYVHAFITVAIALKTHPSFRSKSIFHNVTQVAELESVGGLDVYQSSEFSQPVGGGVNAAVDSNSDEQQQHYGDWYYPTLGYVLFALVESFGSVSITIFWAFANSHLTLEAAERHYGTIVAVAQMGAIAGSTLSAVLGRRRQQPENDTDGNQQQHYFADEEGRVDVNMSADEVGEGDAHITPMLLFIASGCIGVGMVIMALYGQLFSKPMQQTQMHHDTDDGVNTRQVVASETDLPEKRDKPTSNVSDADLFGGLRMIFRYEYLKLVLAASVLYEIALTCMHYELNLIGLDRFGVGISIVDEQHSDNSLTKNASDEGITYIQFMGWYGQTVNILSLFLSFYAFPRLIKNYGLSTTIRIFPTVLLLATIFAFVLFPRNLYFLFISLSICKALTYSVHDPSEEVLYMPTSDVAKFKAKFWIDVVGQRIAKAVGSAINNYAGSVEGIVKYGSLPSIVTALILWLACYQVGMLFDGLIKSGEVVGMEDVALESDEVEMIEQIIDDDYSDDDYSDDDSDLLRDTEEDVVMTKFGKANRTESGSEHVLL